VDCNLWFGNIWPPLLLPILLLVVILFSERVHFGHYVKFMICRSGMNTIVMLIWVSPFVFFFSLHWPFMVFIEVWQNMKWINFVCGLRMNQNHCVAFIHNFFYMGSNVSVATLNYKLIYCVRATERKKRKKKHLFFGINIVYKRDPWIKRSLFFPQQKLMVRAQLS
jgi:hypothetical protein